MGYHDYEDDSAYEARMDARAEYADEIAEERSRTYKYHCGGFASYSGPCGASDCGSCRNGAPPWEDEEEDDEERSVQRTKLVIARKARGHILPGDCVRVTSGFSYLKDGPRTGYFRHESLVGYGPGHSDKAGQGKWPKGREFKA
jgi:hypothetical protein